MECMNHFAGLEGCGRDGTRTYVFWQDLVEMLLYVIMILMHPYEQKRDPLRWCPEEWQPRIGNDMARAVWMPQERVLYERYHC